MAELNVRIDLSFGSRSLRCLMAAGMIFSVATEVASESVTLTTYYPAPSGVYAQMIVTGNTYLSRDAGYVQVGAMPALPTVPGSAFNVNGGATIGSAYDLAGYAAPANGMVVQGLVGIGTTNPVSALDVASGAISVGQSAGAPPGRVGSIYYDTAQNAFLGQYPGGVWQSVGGASVATNVSNFTLNQPNQQNLTIPMAGTWKFCALTLEQSVNWAQGYCMINGSGSNWFLSADRATCVAACF